MISAIIEMKCPSAVRFGQMILQPAPTVLGHRHFPQRCDFPKMSSRMLSLKSTLFYFGSVDKCCLMPASTAMAHGQVFTPFLIGFACIYDLLLRIVLLRFAPCSDSIIQQING
jgi:hypothetical protein